MTLFDYDKYTKVLEIGSANIALKTLRSALIDVQDQEPVEVTLGVKMNPKSVRFLIS